MKTNKVTTLCCAVIIVGLSSLYGDNLTSKYKQMMNTPAQIQQSESNASSVKATQSQHSTSNTSYLTIDEIIKIQDLKQDTFESTSDFNNRREKAIAEFRNKVKFFAQNGSKEYSAGTATMKSYDADKEVIQLKLKWDDDLKSIFSEIKDLKTVSLKISKDEAKKLFGKQETHFFHIDLSYVNTKLTISEISIYNKYKMHQIDKRSKNNSSSAKTKVINNTEVQRLQQKNVAMELELKKLKSQKTMPIRQTSFQKNTNHALTHSQNNSSKQRRNYLYVCYDKKFLTRNKTIYDGCIRANSSCRHLGKHHFGKYSNDSKAHAAFIRCISSNPKFVDYQGL